jgi:hypothetical protein
MVLQKDTNQSQLAARYVTVNVRRQCMQELRAGALTEAVLRWFRTSPTVLANPQATCITLQTVSQRGRGGERVHCGDLFDHYVPAKNNMHGARPTLLCFVPKGHKKTHFFQQKPLFFCFF